MKKSILTLLVLLVCAIQPSTAWDYLTVFFNNGSQPAKFYLTAIDSICYSKIDIDSIAQSDWQVQEIWTPDSTYRYMLSDIDSISYTKVNIDDLANDIAVVNSEVGSLFMQCDSINQLSEHISYIQNVEGVEDVWTEGQTLYVKIKDFEPIAFLYPPHPNSEAISDSLLSLAIPLADARAMRNQSSHKDHCFIDAHSACIVNQPYYDEDRKEYKVVSNILDNWFESMDIQCDIIDKPLPEFFRYSMFNYDLLLIITHGGCVGKERRHWLLTGEELLSYDGKKHLDKKDEDAKKILEKLMPYRDKSEISYHWINETRNGKKIVVIYTMISEDYINNSPNSFKNSAIIFNAACESMKDNDNMGDIFVKKGAGYYLGYSDSNTIGYLAGAYFFKNMLNGKCTEAAFKAIPNGYKEEKFYHMGSFYHPILKKAEKAGDNNALCITRPLTISAASTTLEGNDATLLKGCIKLLSSNASNNYGIQLSTNSDMTGAKDIEADTRTYDEATLYMNWEATLDNGDLQPNTTYYYRAYMNDGYSNCYGEIKQFTTKEAEEDTSDYVAYAVLNDSTLTFYYDNMKDKRVGRIYLVESDYHYDSSLLNRYAPPWENKMNKAIFHSSFAKYTPKIADCWFYGCKKLTKIENLQYFNTNKVVSMMGMFCGCSSLTSLDLSSFNTAHVKGMRHMFRRCSSLSNLDLRSFNTTNVWTMEGMFYECNSLTSLDISSFNTVNVEEMHYMFSGCSSLTSLDLSSFNTVNVKKMHYMFWGCISLTSLDFRNLVLIGYIGEGLFRGLRNLKEINLSNANTSSATSISGLFCGCCSLTSIDISSFDTTNVTNMEGLFSDCSSLTILDLSHFKNGGRRSDMFSNCRSLKTIYANDWNMGGHGVFFYGCDSLVGGQGTKIGNNFYGYDSKGNALYYYCQGGPEAARIDGGKDRPGLFTAK